MVELAIEVSINDHKTFRPWSRTGWPSPHRTTDASFDGRRAAVCEGRTSVTHRLPVSPAQYDGSSASSSFSLDRGSQESSSDTRGT